MSFHNLPQQPSAGAIADQLKTEEEKLCKLREGLDRSKKLKSEMLGILDSFEKRLGRLEGRVFPLYEQTSKLQKKQKNIAKTLKTIDASLSYYSITEEMETLIRDTTPCANLTLYLGHLSKLKEAVKFFATDRSYTSQYMNARDVYQLGCTNLEHEFRELIAKGSLPLKPDTLTDVLDENFEVVDSKLKSLETLRLSIAANAKIIAQWLLANTELALQHELPPFLQSYVQIRGETMWKTLNVLQEHQRSASGGSQHRLGSASNSPAAGSTGTLSRIGESSPKSASRKISVPVKVIGERALRKITVSTSSASASYRRSNTVAQAPSDMMQDIPGEQETETFLLLLGGLDALLQVERNVMREVIAKRSLEFKTLRKLILKPLQLCIYQGETVIEITRRSILGRQEYACIICLLPVATYLHSHQEQLEKLMKDEYPELHQKLNQQILKAIDSLCIKGSEEFVETVKMDQDKFVPKDATVHQATSNTLSFLKQLMDLRHCLAVVLAGTSVDPEKIAVPKLFARILSALGLNLCNKAELYSDPFQKSLFLCNNFNRILKSLQQTGILKIICEQNREVEAYYQNQVEKYKNGFLTCWDKIRGTLRDFEGAARKQSLASSVSSPESINREEREALKLTFTTFNHELEYIEHACRGYTVPDLELANRIKEESKQRVFERYAPFYQKYHNHLFSKTPEKYIRYSSKDVEIILDRLFDSNT